MLNSNIITAEAVVDSLYKLNTDQDKSLESCSERILKLKLSGKITEFNYLDLCNIIRELEAMREIFVIRLLNSMKRGNILKS